MRFRIWAHIALVVLTVAACSRAPRVSPRQGQVVVVVTIDWEGAYISPEGLDALDAIRTALGTAPLTHFISAGYFTKPERDPSLEQSIAEAVRPGDEVAVHVHAWKSLVEASGVQPKLSPSFLTGTDKLLEFEDDIGFDVDLDAYTVPELRAILATSRRLLEQTRFPITRSFRAGGYLGTPKMRQALQEEGYVVDSSATDHRQLDERNDALPGRIKDIWPEVDTSTQPFYVTAPAGPLLEMPIAAFADYATADEIVGIIEAAHARLGAQKTRDQFVILGFHQETAQEFGPRLVDAMAKVRARPDLTADLVFVTLEEGATRARIALQPAAK